MTLNREHQMDVAARMARVSRTLDLTDQRLARTRRSTDRTQAVAGLNLVLGDDGWRASVAVHADGGVAWTATREVDDATVVAVNPAALVRAVDERMRLDGSFQDSVRTPRSA